MADESSLHGGLQRDLRNGQAQPMRKSESGEDGRKKSGGRFSRAGMDRPRTTFQLGRWGAECGAWIH